MSRYSSACPMQLCCLRVSSECVKGWIYTVIVANLCSARIYSLLAVYGVKMLDVSNQSQTDLNCLVYLARHESQMGQSYQHPKTVNNGRETEYGAHSNKLSPP